MAKLAWVGQAKGIVDDRLNPIVVKELRQAVNSKFVTAILMLFLMILLVVLGGFLLLGDTRDTNSGGAVFMILHGIMLSTCLIFTPMYVGIRLAAERSGANTDLLFITTIKPSSIVWGKLLAGMTVSLLIFSACAPFMVITYLMRGIDLPTIFLILAIDLLFILGVLQASITIAAMPVSVIVKAFLGLIAMGGLVMVCTSAIFVASEFIYDGVGFGGGISWWDLWGPLVTVSTLGLTGAGLLFFIAVAMLTANSANRARPLRLYLTATWLITGLVAILSDLGYIPYLGFGAIEVWTIVTMLIASLAMICSGSERDVYGQRLLKKAPQSVILRPLAFLFTSGAAAGLIWTSLIVGATILAAFISSEILAATATHPTSVPLSYSSMYYHGMDFNFADDFAYIIPLPIYALAYSLTGVLIRRGIIGQGANPTTAGAFAMLLLVLCTILPFIAMFAIEGDNWDRASSLWYILNPFGSLNDDLDPGYWLIALAFSGAWALIALGLLSPWLLRQVRSYKPLTEDDADASPTASQHAALTVPTQQVHQGTTDG
ncbi:MAG: hypothetical protein ACIAXF_14835 [Phycisphaerales bacterium JB063]